MNGYVFNNKLNSTIPFKSKQKSHMGHHRSPGSQRWTYAKPDGLSKSKESTPIPYGLELSIFIIMLLISPTRSFIDVWKMNDGPEMRRSKPLQWNCFWFALESATLFYISYHTIYEPVNYALLAVAGVFAFWRVNEIVYAFVKDVRDTVEGIKRKSQLSNDERLGLLARSVFGLIFWFAILYAICSHGILGGGFKVEQQDFFDTFYFSAVTFFGIGQEGQEVEMLVLRIVQVYEVVAAFILLVTAITLYLDRDKSLSMAKE